MKSGSIVGNSAAPGARFTSLVPSYEDQGERFSAAFSVLTRAIADRAFPAASLAVTHHGQIIALKAFGRLVFESDVAALGADATSPSRSAQQDSNPNASPATIFDIASLTKVIATTTAAMILYERGSLDLDAPVDAVVPEFTLDEAGDRRRSEITPRMLLAHSSGLPAHEKLYLKHSTREGLLGAALRVPLAASPGTHAEYSDIGFIVLGETLERISGESIDVFSQREIFGPLGMADTTFNPPAVLKSKIAPTQNDVTFRHRVIQGEVQDENASVLGGVAAHAGVFATAEDMAKFAQSMLAWGANIPARDTALSQAQQSASPQDGINNRSILRPETIALFTRREPTPPGTSRALGWDTPSSPSQSGKYLSQESFGHLGYTGTSLWIDPTRQLSIILLTNRTWPDCKNQTIKQIRPKFHDAVVEALNAT